eukprot:163347-Alexandrium_andersonii.AAC.1
MPDRWSAVEVLPCPRLRSWNVYGLQCEGAAKVRPAYHKLWSMGCASCQHSFTATPPMSQPLMQFIVVVRIL